MQTHPNALRRQIGVKAIITVSVAVALLSTLVYALIVGIPITTVVANPCPSGLETSAMIAIESRHLAILVDGKVRDQQQLAKCLIEEIRTRKV